MRSIWVVMLTCLGLCFGAVAADETRDGHYSDPNNSRTEKTTFLESVWSKTSIVPVLLYSPETSLMLGAGTLTLFNLAQSARTRPSSVSLFGMNTLNQQKVFIGSYELRGADDRHVFQQIFRFIDWPDQFYGLGNQQETGIEINDADGQSRNYIKLTDRYYQIRSEYLFQLVDHFYLGVAQRWRFSQTPGVEQAAAQYGFDSYAGAGDLVWSGLMPILMFDSRNKLLWPSEGAFVRGDVMVYHKWLASDFNAKVYQVDGRFFFKVSSHQVIAFRSVVQRATGNMPFQGMPALGGPELFRGWYLGRLRDRALNCNQIEVRHELDPQYALVGFGAVGRVAPSLSQLSPDGYRFTGGAGFRYALNRQERANLRLDVAYGEALEFYFQFKEAF